MTRGRGRSADCDRSEADARPAQAGAFAVNAELDPLSAEASGSGQDAAHHLRRLLSVKRKAQYDHRNPTIAETKQALRNMRALFRIASSFS